MYKVINKEIETEFPSLDMAMAYAKTLDAFVSITGSEFEIVGIFGVDEVTDPNYNGWISRKQGV
jgi:hypothetical protein